MPPAFHGPTAVSCPLPRLCTERDHSRSVAQTTPMTRGTTVWSPLSDPADQALAKAVFSGVFEHRFDASAVRHLFNTPCQLPSARQTPSTSPDHFCAFSPRTSSTSSERTGRPTRVPLATASTSRRALRPRRACRPSRTTRGFSSWPRRTSGPDALPTSWPRGPAANRSVFEGARCSRETRPKPNSVPSTACRSERSVDKATFRTRFASTATTSARSNSAAGQCSASTTRPTPLCTIPTTHPGTSSRRPAAGTS